VEVGLAVGEVGKVGFPVWMAVMCKVEHEEAEGNETRLMRLRIEAGRRWEHL